MKIVMTLGGNALLERGEVMSADNQARNIAKAVEAIQAVAHTHDLILSHGNGPQVGLIALQNFELVWIYWTTFWRKVCPYQFQ